MKAWIRKRLEAREKHLPSFEERLAQYAERREVLAKRCAEWRKRQKESEGLDPLAHLPKNAPVRRRKMKEIAVRREELRKKLKELWEYGRHVREQRENGRWVG